jgi:hypothetical protein
MTYRLLIPFLLLLSFGVPSVASAQKGSKINAKKEKFTITMPKSFGTPKRSSEPLESDAGPITMITYSAANERGACMVMYGAFPEGSFDGRTSEQILDAARDSAMANMGATLAKQEDYTVDGHPARSCYYTAVTEGTPVYARFDYILVQPALYQVAYVAMNAEDLESSDIVAYFGSFRLMK